MLVREGWAWLLMGGVESQSSRVFQLPALTPYPAFCGFPLPMVSGTNCKPLFSLKINMLMGLGEAL